MLIRCAVPKNACALVSLLLASACSDAPESGASAPGPTTDLDVAWSAFATCLIGEPLTDGELASQRLRQIDLTIVRAKAEERPTIAADWPQQCGALLTKAGSTAPEIEARGLRDAIRRIVTLGFSNVLARSTLPSSTNSIDDLFAAAVSAGVRHESIGRERPPTPTPSPVTFEPFSSVNHSMLTRASVPDDRFMMLLGWRAASCRPESSDQVRCRELEGGWGERSIPIARAASVTRELFVDRTKGAVEGVVDSKHTLVAPFGERAFLSDTDTILDVARGQAGPVLLRKRTASEEVERIPVTMPKDLRGATLLGDVMVGWRPAPADRVVVSLSSLDDGVLSRPIDLGQLEGWTVEAHRRRTSSCDALFFLARRNDMGMSEPAAFGVSLRAPDGGWPPIVTHELGDTSLWSRFDADDRSALECGPGFASVRIVAGGALTVRCDATSCKEERNALPEVLSKEGLLLRLGDHAVLVSSWSGSTTLSQTAGLVQYRFGSLSDLESAPTRLLAVGSAHGGLAERYGRPSGFVHDGRAYVFFSARGLLDGTFGVSFGPDGVPTPITALRQ